MNPRGLAFSLLLTSCSVGSLGLPKSGPLPVAWRNVGAFPVASPSADLGRWWKSFEDPVLTQLIQKSLANSPDIDLAMARVRQARANTKATAASLFPSLSGSASGRTGFSDLRGGPSTTSESYSAGLSASWEVDLYGRNRNNLLAAAANFEATQETFYSVQASLASEVASAYVRLRSSEAGLSVLNRNLANQEETFRFVSWRTEVGEADEYERIQAETSLKQSRGAIPSIQQNIEQTKNLINRLCGYEPGTLDSTLGSRTGDVPVPASRLAIGVPTDAIRQRPDVRIAGYQLLSSAAQTEASYADRFPSLNLSGSLGMSSLKAGKLFDPQAISGSLAAGLAGPIFDAGRISANIEANEAGTDQALQNYRASILTALSEVEDALIACMRSGERLTIIKDATVLAREADRIARLQYEAGELDFLSVLDSQRTLLGLEDSLLSTQADRSNAYVSLYRAVGGGWNANR